MSSVIIHGCEFPNSVKTQQDVWVVYHWLKAKMGGKAKAPKIEKLVRLLSENWEEYFLEYTKEQNINSIFNQVNVEEKTLTTKANHRQRDTIAIANLKKYVHSMLEDPKIDRKKLKTLLENYYDY